MVLMIAPETLPVSGRTYSSQAPKFLQEVDVIDSSLLLLPLYVGLDPRRVIGELEGKDCFRPKD